MLYGGKELRSNPNQYIELRPHRLLIYGGGEFGSNLLSPMEFEGNRLLLYGAPDLGPLPPLGPGAVLPLARLRVRGSPPLLRLCVVTTVETMLVSTAPEVPRIPLQPGLDIRLLSSRLTCRRGARILPLLQPRVDLEPTPACHSRWSIDGLRSKENRLQNRLRCGRLRGRASARRWSPPPAAGSASRG